ncbi:MAG: isochorismate synthase, partial [Cyanobacteria bacterium P01_D01_bin.105]
KSPAIAPFMPVVQYGRKSTAHSAAQPTTPWQFETQADSLQFLHQSQQRVIATRQSKIASLSFVVAPIPPWAVLAELGSADTRHFYYDAPQSPAPDGQSGNQSMVGIGTVIDCRVTGASRFSKAQAFIDFWQPHFCVADPIGRPTSAYPTTTRFLSGEAMPTPKGYFFCSATFFAQPHQAAYFAPAYVFVPCIQVTTQAQASLVTFNRLITDTTNLETVVSGIYEQLHQVAGISSGAETWGQTGASLTAALRYRLTKDVVGFEQTVRSVLTQMRSQAVHKVVISDVADVVMPSPVDVVRSLQVLRHNHPDCTVFSVGNGRGQSFIGASPERLLRISYCEESQGGRRELMTEALAGTASRSHEPGLDIQLGQSLMNSEKERYEHRVVVEFILKQLRSLGLTPHYTAGPKLLRLLNLQHLHTPIRATLQDGSVQPLEILANLHPTPAVAGLPRQLACTLIREYETFERGLYTAPIGWIDTDGNSEFIVGIRSALINGCKARLYAGAGIVSGSEPKKELAEIRLKLQALLNALVCN